MNKSALAIFVVWLAMGPAACDRGPKAPVEIGRWTDPPMNAVFIFYHLPSGISEDQLRAALQAISRKQAEKYDIVMQVAVYDEAQARKLASPATKAANGRMEFMPGSDLLEGPSLKIKGGVVYTYYKDGDYDEWIYIERRATSLSMAPAPPRFTLTEAGRPAGEVVLLMAS